MKRGRRNGRQYAKIKRTNIICKKKRKSPSSTLVILELPGRRGLVITTILSPASLPPPDFPPTPLDLPEAPPGFPPLPQR